MYIGEVSKLTGLTIKSIRFYEQKKLISTPQRKGRYRIYNQKIIDQLKLLIKAKALGFTLKQFYEVQTLSSGQAEAHNNNDPVEIDWSMVFQYLETMQKQKREKISTIESEILEIEAMRHEIKKCF